MPKGDRTGRMHGFQLWANLPASLKMTEPRYQDLKARDIPVVMDDDGTQVRIICGSFWALQVPWGALPPTRSIWTYRFPQVSAEHFRLRRRVTRSLMYLLAPASSATLSVRLPCRPKLLPGATLLHRQKPTIVLSFCSIAATR